VQQYQAEHATDEQSHIAVEYKIELWYGAKYRLIWRQRMYCT